MDSAVQGNCHLTYQHGFLYRYHISAALKKPCFLLYVSLKICLSHSSCTSKIYHVILIVKFEDLKQGFNFQLIYSPNRILRVVVAAQGNTRPQSANVVIGLEHQLCIFSYAKHTESHYNLYLYTTSLH